MVIVLNKRRIKMDNTFEPLEIKNEEELKKKIQYAVKNDLVMFCVHPKRILDYAKYMGIFEGLSVIGYQQLSSAVSFNYPILIDKFYENMKQHFPGFKFIIWEEVKDTI